MSSEIFEIIPLNDNPINDARLLGHDTIVTTLKNFIESEHMLSASSIAVDGDWGSGKTSVMQTVQKKIDQNKVKVLFFEAWKYEYTNPALGLVTELAKMGDLQKAQRIIEVAAFLLLEKFVGLPFDQIVAKIRDEINEPINFHKSIQEIVNGINKKLLIIIDDLDRCDIENTLQILALMKLFLSVDNCVTIAAVDFQRLEQAWKIKYQVKDETNSKDSKNYLDKIFQIRIAIPEPYLARIQEYYGHITKNMPRELLLIFSKVGPKNPRSIKRLLNLITFRTFLLDNELSRMYSSCIWSILEYHMTNDSLTYLEERLPEQGMSISKLMYLGTWKEIEKYITNVMPTKKREQWDLQKIRIIFEQGNALLKKLDITEFDFKTDLGILYNNTKETVKN